MNPGPARLVRAALAIATVALVGACGSGGGASDGEQSATSGPASAAAPAAAISPVATAPTPDLPAEVTGTDGVAAQISDVGRIVVLDGGLAEIVYALGLGANVVGRDITTTIPEAADVPVVTSGHSVSAEGLLALRPSVVLADVRTRPKAAVDQLRGAGVPVVRLPRAVRLDEIPGRIRAVAAAVGLPDEGEALVRRMDAQIAAARRPQPERPLRVAFLYLRGNAGIYLLGGRGSGADGLIEALGAVDVGAEAGLGDFTPLTPEALVAAKPDAILVMTEGLESVGGIDGLLEVNGVAQTPAGHNRRFAAVDDGLLLSFGPRTPEALDAIAAGLGLD